MIRAENAIERLNTLLPLAQRKQQLDEESLTAYRKIMQQLAFYGRINDKFETDIINKLSGQDLIVIDEKTGKIKGAYPFSLQQTAHHLVYNEVNIYAMCALDALAVSAVYGFRMKITSQCGLTETPITIILNGDSTEKVSPFNDVQLGVQWQDPGSCAADNLCLQMVFLKDRKTAEQWQSRFAGSDIFTLDEAIYFAGEYFKPLLK